jgi:hypothetical protein
MTVLSRRRYRYGKSTRPALTRLALVPLVLVVLAGGTANRADASVPYIGGVSCQELQYQFTITYPRTDPYGLYAIVHPNGYVTYSEWVQLYGSSWWGYIGRRWWPITGQNVERGEYGNFRVYWFSYKHWRYSLMGGCDFPIRPGL